jgi:hypothetical protein
MSGGSFDHQNYRLIDMADTLDAFAYRCAKGEQDEYGNRWRAEARTLAKMRKTAKELRVLERKLHLIDYWMAGDSSEDSIHAGWRECEKPVSEGN